MLLCIYNIRSRLWSACDIKGLWEKAHIAAVHSHKSRDLCGGQAHFGIDSGTVTRLNDSA